MSGEQLLALNKKKVFLLLRNITYPLSNLRHAIFYLYCHNFYSFDSLFVISLLTSIHITLSPSLPPFKLDPANILANVKTSCPNSFYKVVLRNPQITYVFKCRYKLRNISLDTLTNNFFPSDIPSAKKNTDFPHALMPFFLASGLLHRLIPRPKLLSIAISF